jgi:hypothetical protein
MYAVIITYPISNFIQQRIPNHVTFSNQEFTLFIVFFFRISFYKEDLNFLFVLNTIILLQVKRNVHAQFFLFYFIPVISKD